MSEISSQKQITAEQLQSVVSNILTGASFENRYKPMSAAAALGISAGSVSELKTTSLAEEVFFDAIKPIIEVLSDTHAPKTRDSLRKLKQANMMVNILLGINQTSDFYQPTPQAEQILLGFKVLYGSYAMTLPVGMTVFEAGLILNEDAERRYWSNQVFDTSCAAESFWKQTESEYRYSTDPGRTFQFQIPADSVGMTLKQQISRCGSSVPMGALVLAEACLSLMSNRNDTLFKDDEDRVVGVRTSQPDLMAISDMQYGVMVTHDLTDVANDFVAYGRLI